MYIGYSLLFPLIGGIEATIIRVQLAIPHNTLVPAQVFNRLFTMHGTTMIFFVAIPILFGFANYLAPELPCRIASDPSCSTKANTIRRS